MQQYIGFMLNDNEFTIPILKVREIINTPTITRLPQAVSYMKGVINLRGKIIPVVDLKELVGMRKAGDTAEGAKIIVITNRQSVFGILVDSITSVINIKESDIEAPEGFMSEHIERVEGVAKFDDRLVILLDTNKLVDVEEVSEASALGMGKAPVLEAPEQVTPAPARPAEAQKPAQPASQQASQQGPQQPKPSAAPSMQAAQAKADAPKPTLTAPKAPQQKPAAKQDGVTVRELHDVRDALSKRFGDDESKSKYLADLVTLIDALAARDLDQADKMISTMMQSPESDLYQQIGQVTRKLHNSLKDFRNALDPRIRQITDQEVPKAIDSLEFVIKKTEEAANTTMTVVEKYQSGLIEFSQQVETITSPEEFIAYLNRFRENLREDLTDIMIAQEFQDITGQTIRRVIELVNNIEAELVGLIATFGVKGEVEEAQEPSAKGPEKMTQNDIESLLKDFGF